MTVQHQGADAADAVLSFWFDEVGKERWFAKDKALDDVIANRFAALRDAVVKSRAAEWRGAPDRLLAAILLVDQFSRNLFRGSAKAFAADDLALELAELALARGWAHEGPVERRAFFLMPLMHAEDLAVQERSLIEFQRLGSPLNLDFARQHCEQIKQFGRFPGRNAALGRRTTAAEQDALDKGAAF